MRAREESIPELQTAPFGGLKSRSHQAQKAANDNGPTSSCLLRCLRGLAVNQQLQDPAVASIFDELPPRFREPEHKRLITALATSTDTLPSMVSPTRFASVTLWSRAQMNLRRTMLEVSEYNLGRDPEMAAMFKRL